MERSTPAGVEPDRPSLNFKGELSFFGIACGWRDRAGGSDITSAPASLARGARYRRPGKHGPPGMAVQDVAVRETGTESVSNLKIPYKRRLIVSVSSVSGYLLYCPTLSKEKRRFFQLWLRFETRVLAALLMISLLARHSWPRSCRYWHRLNNNLPACPSARY